MHEKVFIHSIECLAHKETANLCVKKTSFSKPYILAIMSKLIKKQWRSVSWQLSLNFKAQLQNQENVINENGSCTFKRNKLRKDKNYLSIYWLCFLQKSAWSRGRVLGGTSNLNYMLQNSGEKTYQFNNYLKYSFII